MKKTLACVTLVTVLLFMSPATSFAASAPTFADTPNITVHQANSSSESFTYTVPSGSNQVLIVFLTKGNTAMPSISQNGVSIPASQIIANFNGTECDGTNVAPEFLAWMAAPTTGTFSISWAGAINHNLGVMTINGAAQSYPIIDSTTCHGGTTGTNRWFSTTLTATSSNTLLLDWSSNGNVLTSAAAGAGQTQFASAATVYADVGSYVTGSSTPNTLQGMSEQLTGSGAVVDQIEIVAITPAAASTVVNPQPFFSW